MNLTTPLGEIMIYCDNSPVDFTPMPYSPSVRALRENPISACYKIILPAENCHKISCILDFCGENTGGSDERFLCSEFIKDSFILTIGAEDENPYFDTERLPNGMEYRLKSSVGYVVFTITWTDNYSGQYDIRTELAADIFSACATTFSDLANFLRHGREIEFAFNGRQYSITNSHSRWNFCCDTDGSWFTLCDFHDFEALVNKTAGIEIDGMTIKEIFDRRLYSHGELHII